VAFDLFFDNYFGFSSLKAFLKQNYLFGFKGDALKQDQVMNENNIDRAISINLQMRLSSAFFRNPENI
jgi:hypothetical protein